MARKRKFGIDIIYSTPAVRSPVYFKTKRRKFL